MSTRKRRKKRAGALAVVARVPLPVPVALELVRVGVQGAVVLRVGDAVRVVVRVALVPEAVPVEVLLEGVLDGVPPKHVQVAQDKFRLGWADPERIELVKLGWQAGVLL